MSDPVSSPPPVGDNSDNRVRAGMPPGGPVAEPIGPGAIVYRPVSGFAIAGFAASCVFALLVLIVAIVALVKGAPFFYSPFILLIPIAGLVLSLIARSHIRASEGTRAGEPLARAGIWISLFTGLGYFVYYSVTGMAVTGQANDFMMTVGTESGFFHHLQQAAKSNVELNEAYLLTLPASNRTGLRGADEEGMRRLHDAPNADGSPGAITLFASLPLPRLFITDTTSQIQIEPLGVQSWVYENNSYLVKRAYRVTTPEGVFETVIPVRSSEGEAQGQVRKWSVEIFRTPKPTPKLTKLGEGLAVLRGHSGEWLQRWTRRLSGGETFDLSKVDATQWSALRLAEKDEGFVKDSIYAIFKSGDRHSPLVVSPEENPGGWEIVDKKVRMTHPFRNKLDRGEELPIEAAGKITVETTTPIDPAAGIDPRAMPDWAVLSFRVNRAAPITGKKMPK